MEQILLYASVVASVVAFITFGVDKLLAKMGMHRVSETFLLAVSFVGGAPGALLAMMLFRHKTRKELFLTIIPVMSVLHIAFVCAVLF